MLRAFDCIFQNKIILSEKIATLVLWSPQLTNQMKRILFPELHNKYAHCMQRDVKSRLPNQCFLPSTTKLASANLSGQYPLKAQEKRLDQKELSEWHVHNGKATDPHLHVLLPRAGQHQTRGLLAIQSFYQSTIAFIQVYIYLRRVARSISLQELLRRVPCLALITTENVQIEHPSNQITRNTETIISS